MSMMSSSRLLPRLPAQPLQREGDDPDIPRGALTPLPVGDRGDRRAQFGGKLALREAKLLTGLADIVRRPQVGAAGDRPCRER